MASLTLQPSSLALSLLLTLFLSTSGISSLSYHPRMSVRRPNMAEDHVNVGSLERVQTRRPAASDGGPFINSFEVMRPIRPPPGAKSCKFPVMTSHLYGNAPPPYVGKYTPPTNCGQSWSLIVLTWQANVRGRQFDRVGDVYFDGLHALRTTTAQPVGYGTRWSFDVDVTQYAVFLKKKRKVSIFLGNYVTKVYTGVFNVTVFLTFYAGKTPPKYADIIIPLGPNNSGYNTWALNKVNNTGSKKVYSLPRNIYRAEMEITVRAEGKDEFFWGNVVDSYLNELDPMDQGGFYGGGPLKEIKAYIGNVLVGVVWPYPVLYTGGINPSFWNPVAGIGAFYFEPYRFDLTPLVGTLVDGKSKQFTLKVDRIYNDSVWSVDGTLHLWLDEKSKQTTGALTYYAASPTTQYIEKVDFTDLFYRYNADVTVTAKTQIALRGFVKTSFGTFSTQVINNLNFMNFQKVLDFYNAVEQTTNISSSSVTKNEKNMTVYSINQAFKFPFSYQSLFYVYPDKSNFSFYSNISHAYNFDKKSQTSRTNIPLFYGNLTESQSNVQTAGGNYDTFLRGAWGKNKQKFVYKSNFQGCYARSLSQANYTFYYDVISTKC